MIAWLIILAVLFAIACFIVEPLEEKKSCCLHDKASECRKFNRGVPRRRGFKLRAWVNRQ